MSSVHRILTGLEFELEPSTGPLNWPAQTEDLVRLSLELARVTRSGLAFAAVAGPPDGKYDCGQNDAWTSLAEQQVERMWRTAAAGDFPVEQAAWFGNPGEEWVASALESQMDLLIVPGTAASGVVRRNRSDIQWPQQAGCPVWFAGRELDSLDTEPPLIVFCDDLTDAAALHLSLAVDLALAWNARLLVVHPLTQSVDDLSQDEEDRLRREVFVRLSRTDFRAIPHGSQLRFITGGLEEIVVESSPEQAPNLIMASAGLVCDLRPQWRGHQLLWASTSKGKANGQ